MVTTPTGGPWAMVHCNNCTSDINAWAEALHGFAKAAGLSLGKGDVYTTLFESAMRARRTAAASSTSPISPASP